MKQREDKRTIDLFGDVNDAARCTDFDVEWSVKNVGWGEYRFYHDKDGKIHIDNECMTRTSIKHVLGILVDNAILDDPVEEEDPNGP